MWFQTPAPLPPSSNVWSFLASNATVFGTAAVTVFGAGWAFGRFMFDRQIGAYKQEVEILNLQLAAARNEVSAHQEKLVQTLADAKGRVMNISSEVRAGSSLLSAIPTLLLMGLLGMCLYSLNMIYEALRTTDARESAFETSLVRKLEPQPALPAANKRVGGQMKRPAKERPTGAAGLVDGDQRQ